MLAGLPLAAQDLFGWDTTPGIVAVEADDRGSVRVWRRLRGSEAALVQELDHAPGWFLTRDAGLIAHLPGRWIDSADLPQLALPRGLLDLNDGLTVVDLQNTARTPYRYLALTPDLDDLASAILDTHRKQSGASRAAGLADLADDVLVWPPVTRYLMLSGRAYYRDLDYSDLRRLQFDLETTGLNEQRDQVILVSLRDSTGWEACIDTRGRGEAALIAELVRLIRERDPDVIENHNIFGFDLRFLATRAARLGVPLALGRDGSEPRKERDVVWSGETWEPFTRWHIAGREVLDTLFAARWYGRSHPALRRNGLKDAARFFGLAGPTREYVPGAEVGAIFRRDPERVRRYALDDVREVDGLSGLLHRWVVDAARRVPRPPELLATDPSPHGLVEPLLTRAYLRAGAALPPADPGLPAPQAGGLVLVLGLVRDVLDVSLAPLEAVLLEGQEVSLTADPLGAAHLLLQALLEDDAAQGDVSPYPTATRQLLAGACRYLGDPGERFANPAAAQRAAEALREVALRLDTALLAAGGTVLAAHGERILLHPPESWRGVEEERLRSLCESLLPARLTPRMTARYRAVYVHGPGSYALLTEDEEPILVGALARLACQEPYGERFIRAVVPLLARGDLPRARQIYRELVEQLQSGVVPVADLCTRSRLPRSSAEYRRSGVRDDLAELLFSSGVRSWRAGQRINYVHHRTGGLRLVREGDRLTPAEADTAYYVERLRAHYGALLAHALEPEQLSALLYPPDQEVALAATDARTLWRRLAPSAAGREG